MAIAATANHGKSIANPPSVTITVSVGNVVAVNLNNGDSTHEPKISDATNGDGKDSLGNTYVKLSTLHWSSSYFYQTIWVSTITSGGSTTIRGSLNGGSPDTQWMAVQEFNGFTGAATGDKTHTAEGSSTGPMDSGATATTTQAAELLIGAFADDFNGSPYGNGSGWTLWDKSADSNGGRAGAAYQVVSSTGAYNATATFVSGSHGWGASIATIYDAGGGAAVPVGKSYRVSQAVNRAATF